MKHSTKGRSNVNSLKKCCINLIARNIDKYEYSDYLNTIPRPIKSSIIRYLTTIGSGFQNDNILAMLLHQHTFHLNLSNSKISDKTLEIISDTVPNLKELILTNGNCQFSTEGFIKAASKLQEIQVLEIGNLNQITDEAIECIGKCCKNLDLLDLSKCMQITDKCVDALKNLKLTKLSLSHTKITDEFFVKLENSILINSLLELNINYCQLTNNTLDHLPWDRLQYVGIEGTSIQDFKFMDDNTNLRFIQYTISA